MPFEYAGNTPILKLSGTPEEMGAEHGRLLKERIQSILELFLRNSDIVTTIPYRVLLEFSALCEPFIPAMYARELRALAEAADVPYHDLLAFNSVADVDGCYMQQVLQCCNFVLLPEILQDGGMIHGRNLDFPFPKEIQAEVIVLVYREPSAPGRCPTLAFTGAGTVGMPTGCTAAGMTAGYVSSPTDDCSMRGTPIWFLIRDVLERADDLDGAVACLKEHPKTCGFNVAIGDGGAGNAYGVEFTHSRFAHRKARGGFLVVDDPAICPRTRNLRLTHPAGAFRFARMMQLITANRNALDVETALGFLRDRYDIPLAREGRSPNCICNLDTIQSVLFLPRAQRALVSQKSKPAPLGLYEELDLSFMRTTG